MGIIIVVIAVAFLGQVIDWKGGSDIAYFGGAVALVTAALTYFITAKASKDKKAVSYTHLDVYKRQVPLQGDDDDEE